MISLRIIGFGLTLIVFSNLVTAQDRWSFPDSGDTGNSPQQPPPNRPQQPPPNRPQQPPPNIPQQPPPNIPQQPPPNIPQQPPPNRPTQPQPTPARPPATPPSTPTQTPDLNPPNQPGIIANIPAGCKCPYLQNHDPVCGSDGITYGNMKILECHNKCGKNVTYVRRGQCSGRG